MSGSDRLMQIAIRHFNQYGYEGTKLSRIAEEAGIRKQSVYAHFQNKDDLFLQLNDRATREEIDYLHAFFDEHRNDGLLATLHALLSACKERFLDNPNVNFLIVTSYIPPRHLIGQVMASYRLYLSHLRALLRTAFLREKESLRIDPEDGPVSFSTLLDGLVTQLVYETPDLYDQSMRISWDIYSRGIMKG
ncbi:TetR/AcrR family transcriptional regulator [Cohnella thermotolerans]|uniref:TetR/AcrR family transcriptional regulator n=1 Tax=Cohnella thermotolerans TaxID=329858 RepID=UPI000428A35C|nr:TetR/AcrR family transcriptional regulator [Cohnella thermotolerans]